MLWITEVVSPGWCLRLRVMMRRTACNITIIMIIIIIQLKKRGEGKERKSRNISLFSSVFLHFHFGFSRILAAAAAASCWLHLIFISYQRRNISEIQMFFFVSSVISWGALRVWLRAKTIGNAIRTINRTPSWMFE